MRSGDVEEHELVDPLVVVERGQFDGIAGVPQFDERDALDHPSGVDVEAGNDPFRQHG